MHVVRASSRVDRPVRRERWLGGSLRRHEHTAGTGVAVSTTHIGREGTHGWPGFRAAIGRGALASTSCSPPLAVTLGMFPNSVSAASASETARRGMDEDHLMPLGGEADAVIALDTARKFTSEAVSVVPVVTDPVGKVELDRSFQGTERGILYAYAELPSDAAQTAIVHLVVNDSTKVWLNGALVHQLSQLSRGENRSPQEFSVALRPGNNRVLVKMDSGRPEIGFVFLPFTESDHRLALAEAAEARFPDEEIISADGDGWVRQDARLPEHVEKSRLRRMGARRSSTEQRLLPRCDQRPCARRTSACRAGQSGQGRSFARGPMSDRLQAISGTQSDSPWLLEVSNPPPGRARYLVVPRLAGGGVLAPDGQCRARIGRRGQSFGARRG